MYTSNLILLIVPFFSLCSFCSFFSSLLLPLQMYLSINNYLDLAGSHAALGSAWEAFLLCHGTKAPAGCVHMWWEGFHRHFKQYRCNFKQNRLSTHSNLTLTNPIKHGAFRGMYWVYIYLKYSLYNILWQYLQTVYFSEFQRFQLWHCNFSKALETFPQSRGT